MTTIYILSWCLQIKQKINDAGIPKEDALNYISHVCLVYRIVLLNIILFKLWIL